MRHEDPATAEIRERYIARTPGSAKIMERAGRVMPRGVTRSLSWFEPYPVVFERGSGTTLVDVDGNEYVDFMLNGLSLIHGHAYPPIREALERTADRGTAWPGASIEQVEFAELLRERVDPSAMVRFTNTGTEATMLAAKLARWVTERPMLIKAVGAYHGSYDDLEAGLGGRGPLPGRVALAEFGNLDSFRRALEENDGDVAALVIEPILYTDGVSCPQDGFLPAVEQLARDAGVLFILDDCLMFRLAEAGSREIYGLSPDITALGKWIGGGLPVGAVVASEDLMSVFDPGAERPLYHGGSFNGNLLGCVSGEIAVRDLTQDRIDTMNRQADALREALHARAAELGVAISTPGEGAAFGLYRVTDAGQIDWGATTLLHLAAVNHGVYIGTHGEMALATATTDAQIEQSAEALGAALADIAGAQPPPVKTLREEPSA
jgi:glutamate-1-semialdehyde 2,1-aminomutase